MILLTVILREGTSVGAYHAVTWSLWTTQTPGTPDRLNGVAWSGSQFVATLVVLTSSQADLVYFFITKPVGEPSYVSLLLIS